MLGLLTELSPAATSQLTTLARAKADLGISDDSTQDDGITSLIDRASSVIATHCGGRVFGLRDLSESFRLHHARRSHHMQTDAAPIITTLPLTSLTSVTEDGTELVQDTDFETDADAGLLWRLRGTYRARWNAYTVVIAYSSGWLLPNDSDRDMPADLEDHCLTLVRSAFYGQGRNPNIAMDLTEGVGRTQYWDRSISSMIIDQPMADALSRYVLRV